MRKNFGTTKYPRENTLYPQDTYEKKFGPSKAQWYDGTMARWYETHETHDCTRPMEFSTLGRYMHEPCKSDENYNYTKTSNKLSLPSPQKFLISYFIFKTLPDLKYYRD